MTQQLVLGRVWLQRSDLWREKRLWNRQAHFLIKQMRMNIWILCQKTWQICWSLSTKVDWKDSSQEASGYLNLTRNSPSKNNPLSPTKSHLGFKFLWPNTCCMSSCYCCWTLLLRDTLLLLFSQWVLQTIVLCKENSSRLLSSLPQESILLFFHHHDDTTGKSQRVLPPKSNSS